MVVKTEFVPVLNGQHALHRTRKVLPVKFISDTGLVILTFFAVFSGLLQYEQNLETMGISLGPSHL